MTPEQRRGLILFGGIALLFFLLAFIAFLVTGPMGIEERFLHAIGQGGEGGEEEGGGIFGFTVEGNVFGYVIILLILVAVSIFLWLKLKKG
jgi:hypothetical protein